MMGKWQDYFKEEVNSLRNDLFLSVPRNLVVSYETMMWGNVNFENARIRPL